MIIEMNTRITDVTVFRDGARVTRFGETQVVPGEHTVSVKGISRYAQEDSFRVKGKGAAILKGIEVKRETTTFEPEGNVKELLGQLKKLEFEQATITDRMQYQESRLINISSIMNQFSTEFGKWYAAKEATMGHLSNMDKTTMELLRKAKKELRKLQREREENDAKILALQANINKVQGQRRTETLTNVSIGLDVRENTTIQLKITYQMSSAGWSPTYDVDIGEYTAMLKRIAMIQNQTLENWEDVSLVVSTASARPVEAVEAQPFYIDIYRPQIGFGTASSRAYDSDDEFEEGDALMDYKEELAAEEPMPLMEERYAESSETLSGTVIYDVPGQITIISDNDPHPVTLTEETFDSKRLHYWNAYAMPEVVAQDEITNADSVLLPGKVKVYAQGDFIGETSIDLIAPREKFRLGTRIAYDVKAEKKLVLKDTEKGGLTRGKTRREYKYKLLIESFSKDPIEIRVVDRIPHSTSERVKVELTQPTILPKKEELGVLEWETKVEKEQKIEIAYGFEVEWEKNLHIRPPLP
ncbi:MAG: mucoidy inhibitor MuiA family protein [Candidatus Thorarchaeota archaeon]|jgi:uncharacterized protein (TIGR02231 family)